MPAVARCSINVESMNKCGSSLVSVCFSFPLSLPVSVLDLCLSFHHSLVSLCSAVSSLFVSVSHYVFLLCSQPLCVSLSLSKSLVCPFLPRWVSFSVALSFSPVSLLSCLLLCVPVSCLSFLYTCGQASTHMPAPPPPPTCKHTQPLISALYHTPSYPGCPSCLLQSGMNSC